MFHNDLSRREFFATSGSAVLALAAGGPLLAATPGSKKTGKPGEPLPIGTQLQLFLDDELIDSMKGLELRLHSPRPAEIVLQKDKPWEDEDLYDPVVIKEGSRYRMWYRTNFNKLPWYTGYAESPDGIQWSKPELGLIDFQGSKQNNLVWRCADEVGYVLSIFKDANPKASDEERYKAIGISKMWDVVGLVSPDGLRWRLIEPNPLIANPNKVDGPFDSHNIVFWDAPREQYVAYLRGWKGALPGNEFQSRFNQSWVRCIRRSVSKDFRQWSKLEFLELSQEQDPSRGPIEHLYKNAATPYYRRPDILLMFPKRFFAERAFAPAKYPKNDRGLSDIAFMFSRDGLHWDRRFLQALIRPGRDWENWHHRAIEVGQGLVPTGAGEMSLYMTEHYETPTVRIRRMVLREDGFVSVHSDGTTGELTTRPLLFEGRQLVMNYATSAGGSILVEVLDAAGRNAGYNAVEKYGDELDGVCPWDFGGHKVGQPFRLRFVLNDADLFSFRFRPEYQKQ